MQIKATVATPTAQANAVMKVRQDLVKHLDVMEQFAPKLGQTLLDYREALRRIASNLMISPLGMKTETAQAKQRMTDYIDTTYAEAVAAKTAIETRCKSDLSDVGSSAADQLAYAMLVDSAWKRAERFLEKGGMDWFELIKKAGTAGDLVMLAAIRLNVESATWGDVGSDDLLPTYQAALDTAELPLLDPPARAARLLLTEIATNWPSIPTNVNYAKYEVDDGVPLSLLFGWAKGTTIKVETPAAASVDTLTFDQQQAAALARLHAVGV